MSFRDNLYCIYWATSEIIKAILFKNGISNFIKGFPLFFKPIDKSPTVKWSGISGILFEEFKSYFPDYIYVAVSGNRGAQYRKIIQVNNLTIYQTIYFKFSYKTIICSLETSIIETTHFPATYYRNDTGSHVNLFDIKFGKCKFSEFGEYSINFQIKSSTEEIRKMMKDLRKYGIPYFNEQMNLRLKNQKQ